MAVIWAGVAVKSCWGLGNTVNDGADLCFVVDVADLLDDEPEVVVPGQGLVHQVKILKKKKKNILVVQIWQKIQPFGAGPTHCARILGRGKIPILQPRGIQFTQVQRYRGSTL
jgi:hypothetical protein